MEAKFFELEQRSDEWFAWRKEPGFVSASDCPALMGFNKYCTPYTLWLYKTGRKERPDLSGNPDVQRGVDLEDEALDKTLSFLGVDPETEGLCGQRGPVKVSLDGLYMDGTTDAHSLIPIEIKCPRQLDAGLWRKYYWQIVAQAFVYDAPFVVFAQYVGGEIYVEEVPVCEEDKLQILGEASRFIAMCEPGSTTHPPLIKGDTLYLDVDAKLIAEYKTNALYLKEVKERQEEIKQKLTQFVESQEVDCDRYAMGDLRYTKTTSSRVDSKALYKAKGITETELEMFRTSTNSCRITIKG